MPANSDHGHRHQHRQHQSQVAQRQQQMSQQNKPTNFTTIPRDSATEMKPMSFQEVLKSKTDSFNSTTQANSDFQSPQSKPNNTGMPDNLKSGIEKLSGHSMDDVKVHYNSDKPAQLQAHAYAQGSDIHLGPKQEKHLPHEAWHVVQQKQGRVQPTMQMKGDVNVNDDIGLEKEADIMGERASQNQTSDLGTPANSSVSSNSTVQLMSSNLLLFILESKDTPKEASLAIIKMLERKGEMVQIGEIKTQLAELVKSKGGNVQNNAKEILAKDLLNSKEEKVKDAQFFQLTNSNFLESINKLGLLSSYQRTGEKKPQPGGATASTLEQHIEAGIPKRLLGYLRVTCKTYAESYIQSNPWPNGKLNDMECEGKDDEKVTLSDMAMGDFKAYNSHLEKIKGAKRKPALSPAAAGKVATDLIGQIGEDHYLHRLAKMAVTREKNLEGMITAQHIYGTPQQHLDNVIGQYSSKVQNPILIRWAAHSPDWHQDESEEKGVRSMTNVPSTDIDVFIGENMSDNEKRADEGQWKPLLEYVYENIISKK